VRTAPDGKRVAVRYRGWTTEDFGSFRSYAYDDPRPEPRPARARMPVIAGDPVKGRALFVSRAVGPCTGCHLVRGEDVWPAGNVGPDLSTYGDRNLPAEYTFGLIYDPRHIFPQSLMPPWGTDGVLSLEEIVHVVAFLTYGIDRVRELFGDKDTRGLFQGDFVCHNARELNWNEPIFHPHTIKAVGGVTIGVIGQAFPYVPVSHPSRFVPGITFGIQDGQAQRLVNELRDDRNVDLVVLLSHNGFSTDVKMAGRVKGLDVILGGHTHDGLPRPLLVGKTLVVNSGSHGKFLSRLDLDVRGGRVRAHRYKLYPVLSNHVAEDEAMARLIRELRAPWEARLAERLAVSESLLYRRGNFNGTFDEIILDALLARFDAEVAFSPGFRWGVTIVPGQAITLEDVYAHTGLSYPNTLSRELTGAEIHRIMEDVADNLFHPDPYYRQGGDMVRLGGVSYVIDPRAPMGRRISEIKVRGAPLEPSRRYKTASWASPGPEAPGPPAFDVVADHLRGLGRVKLDPRPRVKVL